MQYVILVPSTAPAPGGSVGGAGVGAGIQLVSRGLKTLANWGFDRKVNAKLEAPAFQQKIAAAQTPGNGVLVAIEYFEWKLQDVTGFKAKMLDTVVIASTGKTYKEAFTRYLNTDQLRKGPPEGWVGKSMFVWVPPAETTIFEFFNATPVSFEEASRTK